VEAVGYVGCCQILCGLHLEEKTMNDEQTQQADDPSGPGWRDVEVGEVLRETDMFRDDDNGWACTKNTGVAVRKARRKYRRRIEPPQQPEPQQPSDTEPETMEQLREQVATLKAGWDRTKTQLWDAVEARQRAERELKVERDNGMTALRDQNRLGQVALAEALQTWLRPVIELVAEHPEDASPLAVAVLGYLPGIASRLIEE
jgi:hypothetical protein